MKYYEDIPGLNKEVEAETKVSKGKSKYGNYYTPFQNRNKGKRTSNCADLVTVYDCATSSLCAWVSKQKTCRLNRFTYSFKQNKKRNKNKQNKK